MPLTPADSVLPLIPVDTLGALERPAREVFGQVADALLDGSGRLLVLDARYRVIRLFDRDGGFLFETGGTGPGPAEFRDPAALALSEEGRLFAADRHGHVAVYRAEGDSLLHRRTFLVGANPQDVCLLGDDLFVQAPTREGTIHRQSMDDFSEESFGQPPDAAHGIVGLTLGWARLACSEEAGVVVELPTFSPVLRAFRPDGTRAWTDTLPGYRPVRVTEATAGRASFAWATPEGTHRAISLLSRGDRVLVQLGVQDTSRTGPRDYREIVTHLYDAGSGERIVSTTELPWLLAVGRDRAAGRLPQPYPRVTVFDLRRPADEE